MLSGHAESTLGGRHNVGQNEANGRLHERDLYAWSKATEPLFIDRRIRKSTGTLSEMSSKTARK